MVLACCFCVSVRFRSDLGAVAGLDSRGQGCAVLLQLLGQRLSGLPGGLEDGFGLLLLCVSQIPIGSWRCRRPRQPRSRLRGPASTAGPAAERPAWRIGRWFWPAASVCQSDSDRILALSPASTAAVKAARSCFNCWASG